MKSLKIAMLAICSLLFAVQPTAAQRTAETVAPDVQATDLGEVILKFFWEGGPEEGVDIERAQFASQSRPKVVLSDICCITKRTVATEGPHGIGLGNPS